MKQTKSRVRSHSTVNGSSTQTKNAPAPVRTSADDNCKLSREIVESALALSRGKEERFSKTAVSLVDCENLVSAAADELLALHAAMLAFMRIGPHRDPVAITISKFDRIERGFQHLFARIDDSIRAGAGYSREARKDVAAWIESEKNLQSALTTPASPATVP